MPGPTKQMVQTASGVNIVRPEVVKQAQDKMMEDRTSFMVSAILTRANKELTDRVALFELHRGQQDIGMVIHVRGEPKETEAAFREAMKQLTDVGYTVRYKSDDGGRDYAASQWLEIFV